MPRTFVIAAVVCTFWSTVQDGLADEVQDVRDYVLSVGARTVEIDHVVGLSIGVARGDEVLIAEGFGLANVELDVPATADTVYRIGSITKEFTAAAILLLVEDGKVSLDGVLTTYLPEYPEAGDSITIRHLLQHTSGVANFTGLPAYRQERPLEVSQQQVLDRFQNLPLEFPPGDKHRYCNSGYFLLGMVIERASGVSFREFVEQRLFRKLGVQTTYCDSALRIIPHRAAGYTHWGGVLRNASHINLGQTVGAGNLAATVTDMIIWQRGLVAHRLLTDGSFRLMTTAGKLNGGKGFDYGLGIRTGRLGDHKFIRHGGGISGFRSDLAYYPESEITIAIAANCDRVNTRVISDRIARYVMRKKDATVNDPAP
jgi:CubicO group peptidase (beta-lactamase class C family)